MASSRQQGFTIVEIMIVLAVAAVIMLVIFLAVPTLQRNSRNTQRKNDITQLIQALDEYRSNNLGKIPTSAGSFATVFGASTPTLSILNISQVAWSYTSYPRTSPYYYGVYDPVLNEGVVDGAYIDNYLKCGTDTFGREAGVPTGAGLQNVVALFRLEDGKNGGVHTLKCIEI
jgi:prepilin-type N-terminal cleavage/methylation domain-containing protein